MRMEADPSAAGPVISGIAEGGFRVGDAVFAALLLTPDSVSAWTAPPLSALDVAALAPLLAIDPPPEFILLGTGLALTLPPRAFVKALEAQGIGVEAMDSRAAARAWGVLRGEGRWIAAALFALT